MLDVLDALDSITRRLLSSSYFLPTELFLISKSRAQKRTVILSSNHTMVLEKHYVCDVQAPIWTKFQDVVLQAVPNFTF